MFEIVGKYGTCKIFTDAVEETAVSQIYAFMSSPIVENSKVRFMPDIHAGSGCVIGTTFTLTGKTCPSVVGVDIGCSVLAINFGKENINFSELDKFIRDNIPSGHKINNDETAVNNKDFIHFVKKVCERTEQEYNYVMRSIGSLGGGNHFIEVNTDENGEKWLCIHTGSRNFGLKIANWHQKKANKIHGGNMGGLAYLEGDDALDYFEDMFIAQQFSAYNRNEIANRTLEEFNLVENERVESVHNYIDFKDNIVRKGAISAHKGEMVIIPLNMRDGSIIGVGKGNDDWNNSAPHGAGRLMSRKKAKEEISLEDFEKSMDGIWTSCVSRGTLDEAPMAYKNADHIIKYLEPTVEIKHMLKPLYNFKAQE